MLFANKNMGVFLLEEDKQSMGGSFGEAFFILDPDSDTEDFLPAGWYVTVIFKGPYTRTKGYYHKIYEAIEASEYRVAGPGVEIYRIDVHMTADEEEFLTEIQVPVERC